MVETALIFLLAAVLVVPLAKWLKLGAVLGFLVAGMAIGPNGLGVVSNPDAVVHVSELGVVLLLFIIGLELSPRRLWVMRRAVFGVGLLQVLVCMLAIAAIAHWGFARDLRSALVLGAALALSSTAMGLQILAERKQLQSPAGRLSFSILLFQDIAAIPLLAIIPLLHHHADPAVETHLLLGAAKVFGVIALVVIGGRYLLRPVFRMVARAETLEVSIAAAFLVVLGTGWLVEQVGISMSLGAFLAGVLLADSEYRHELESHLEPFKGLLLGLFFIGVGMSAQLDLLWQHPLKVLGITLLLLTVKASLLWAISRSIGRLDRTQAWQLAMVLASGGEFAFVVLKLAETSQVVAPKVHHVMLLVITLSMALTPILMTLVSMLPNVSKDKKTDTAQRDYDTIEDDSPQVLIAGFGRVGQIVGRILTAENIPFVALENSYEQVEHARQLGRTSIYYGNPARPELLRAAKAHKAKVLVLATGNPQTNLAIARMARRAFPNLTLIARARNRRHAFRLMDLLEPGHVVRETLYSSFEMSRQTLEELGIDKAVADASIERFHKHDQQLLDAQHLIYDDEAKLAQTSREALTELEELLAADHQSQEPPPSPDDDDP